MVVAIFGLYESPLNEKFYIKIKKNIQILLIKYLDLFFTNK